MGLKLGSALLLFLPLLSLALANADVEDDSRQDLVNPPANQVGVNQGGHDLVKRGAGRGRKSCEGKRWVVSGLSIQVPTLYWTFILQNLSHIFNLLPNFRCGKKKTPQKAKKGKKGNRKPKNSEKKRKSLRRKQSQRQKKKKDETKKKSGKKSKKRKGGKKKESQKKSLKERKKSGSRRRGEGSSRGSTGRQITGNATSCAMKLV